MCFQYISISSRTNVKMVRIKSCTTAVYFVVVFFRESLQEKDPLAKNETRVASFSNVLEVTTVMKHDA